MEGNIRDKLLKLIHFTEQKTEAQRNHLAQDTPKNKTEAKPKPWAPDSPPAPFPGIPKALKSFPLCVQGTKK